MARLFVAAWPSREVVAALRELPRADVAGLRWTTPDQWHVTLRFVGAADAAEVAERLSVRALPAATVRLGPALDRLGERLLMVPASGADELAAVVHDALGDIGEPPQYRFRGHLTIARARRDVDLPLIGAPFDASFRVDEIAIVESDLTPDAAVYSTVARVPTIS